MNSFSKSLLSKRKKNLENLHHVSILLRWVLLIPSQQLKLIYDTDFSERITAYKFREVKNRINQ